MKNKTILKQINEDGQYVFPNGSKLVLTHYSLSGFDNNLIVIDKEGKRLWGIKDVYPYGGATIVNIYDDGTFFFNTFEGMGGVIDSSTFELIEKQFNK